LYVVIIGIMTNFYPSLTIDLGPQISECHRIAGSHWACGVPAV